MNHSPFFIPFAIFSKILFVVLRQPSTIPRRKQVNPNRTASKKKTSITLPDIDVTLSC
nr:MAG TPA: hypothetical protein [Bacteriophage sp.]